MAQVGAPDVQKVDRLLEKLMRAWQGLPAAVAAIDTWEPLDQLQYTEEWPHHLDRLATLDQLAAARQLSPSQEARYAALRQLVDAEQSRLEALLAS